MDTRSFIATALRGIALIACGVVAVQATSIGYLATVGPVPLRFRPVPVRKAFEIKPLPAASHTSSETLPPVQPPIGALGNPPPPGFGSSTSSDMFLGGLEADSMLPPPATQATDLASNRPAANELLVVTPQMLIDYFKPTAGSTNGAGVSVLVPVNFTPPTPSATPLSHAIYKTQ